MTPLQTLADLHFQTALSAILRRRSLAVAVLALAGLLATGCASTRSVVYPEDPASQIEHRQVTMRLHSVDRSTDSMLAWIDIVNGTGETVVISRSQQTIPTYVQIYPQIRLLGAGEPVIAKRQSTVRTIDKSHYRILAGEHARLAVGFISAGIDRARGLTVDARVWQGSSSDLWSLPVPDEIATPTGTAPH